MGEELRSLGTSESDISLYHLHLTVLKEILGIYSLFYFLFLMFWLACIPFVDDMKLNFHNVLLYCGGLASALSHHCMFGWRAIVLGSREISWPFCLDETERSEKVDCHTQDVILRSLRLGVVPQREEAGKNEHFSLIFCNLSWSLSFLNLWGVTRNPSKF